MKTIKMIHLGEMSREYTDYNIRKFAAGGPKYKQDLIKNIKKYFFRQYGLKMVLKNNDRIEKNIIKLRGFLKLYLNIYIYIYIPTYFLGITLDIHNSNYFQFDTIQSMVYNFLDRGF